MAQTTRLRQGGGQAPSVALVSMPFHQCMMPPIGLGILKSALSAAGLRSTVYNFNLELLPDIGATAEEAVKVDGFLADRMIENQVGEWVFAPPDAARDERYLALLPDLGFTPEHVSRIRRMRSRVDALLVEWAHRVVAGGHDIVGFSFSLGRTRANVRLAEALRQLSPHIQVMGGGFSASGDMGRALLEAFPVIDLVCHTEADELIVPIVRTLRGEPGTAIENLNGISYRRGGRLVTRQAMDCLPDIERTPLPDYDDYFEQVEAMRATWDAGHELPLWVPIELARGCWWGAREHCAFCSNNGDRMAFRAKSVERAVRDIDALAARHRVTRFLVVDNILVHDYYRSLLPRLAAARRGHLFHWEVRPHIGRAQAATLARAGVLWVQPGIESLSTPVLRLMHKGTTAIDNIHALKWLLAYGIESAWNILFVLPGERREWYEEMARTIPRLMHLAPPKGLIPITLGRFSPTFLRARELGVKVFGPTEFARLAFDDVSPELLVRLVAEFAYEIEGRPPDLDAHIVRMLEPLVTRWRENHAARGCTLSWVDGPGEALIVEGPLLRPERMLRVRGLLYRFLKACESPRSERLLLRQLAGNAPDRFDGEQALTPRAYRALIAELGYGGTRPEEGPAATLADVVDVADERGWVYRESSRIVSLPVSRTHFVTSAPFQLEAAYHRYLAESSAS